MTDIDPSIDETTHAPSARRRTVLALVVILLVAALALTPPLLNVDRLRHRIATSMSQSLGRPVHLDRVSFHLLPMPGFTLQNLVVSEDPAFGYEPVIRANRVEATLRVSSLWRRQVEISTIRFDVDEFGAGPSVNIVRNAQGRWNLDDILIQAAHVNTAPTAQRKAGPAPRFPYIEATGARVNLKLGNEKMPFSLTDAEFALWLPDPQEWHLRLQGHPARTDTNASDTGEVRLEGTLGRAPTMATVAVNLTLAWAHAQMGEASRLFTGVDAGWRGTVEAGATLVGQVNSAKLTTNLHLIDLRRADFVPAQLLDVSAHCTAAANLTLVTLTQAVCTIPDGGPQPITLASAMFDVQHAAQAAASVEVHEAPLAWALDWARLFTERIPAGLEPVGTIDGTLSRAAGGGVWDGELQGTVKSVNGFDFSEKPVVFDWRAAALGLELQPVAVRLGGASQLALTGTVDLKGYTARLAGTASAAQIMKLGDSVLPPLGQELVGLSKLPVGEGAVDIECSRPFDGVQQCVAKRVETQIVKGRRRR
jgi:hypothetical protein